MSLSLIQQRLEEHGGPEGLVRAWARELGREPAPEEVNRVLTDWRWIARPEQLAPEGDWTTWVILAGRGFGKTRSGGQFVKEEIDAGRAKRVALVGATAADVRDVMVEGESGILALYAHLPESQRPIYRPSKRRLIWPNGAIATTYSAEKANRLRGPQHDLFWADELASWSINVSQKDKASNVVRVGRPQAWDQLMFGLRLGRHPRGVVTTTPRPTPIIRELVQQARDGADVVVRKGTTYDNQVNLAPSFFGAVIRAYEGTRIGRQELNAEVLDDNPNALWKQALIDEARIDLHTFETKFEVIRGAVAIDPAVTSNPESDMTGIVGGFIGRCRAFPTCRGEIHGAVYSDVSGIYSPAGWARAGVKLWQALEGDRVIGEVNNGGDLVEANIRANGGEPNVPYKGVRASKGKEVRAEPVAGLYERHMVHHVGTHGALEDELTQWDPISGMASPNRLDALVWLLSEMMLKGGVVEYAGGTMAPRRS